MLLGCIADDFTGATDLANTLVRQGMSTVVLLGVPSGRVPDADAVIVAVAHSEYRAGGWALVRGLLKPPGGFVADVPALLDRAATPDGVTLWRL